MRDGRHKHEGMEPDAAREHLEGCPPKAAIAGPLRTMFNSTAIAAILSAARVSPTPLKPAKATASRQSGRPPHFAVATR